MSPDFLKIANKKFQSRLILGTGNYPNVDENLKSIEKSGTEILTIAVRRVNNENLKNYYAEYIDSSTDWKDILEVIFNIAFYKNINKDIKY